MKKNTNLTPAFLCIGAQRSASSWLYEMLRQHPQLWLPPVKELHYLDAKLPGDGMGLGGAVGSRRRSFQHLSKMSVLMSRRFWARRLASNTPIMDAKFAFKHLFKRFQLDDYPSVFAAAARQGLVTGEITPSYAILPVERIKLIHSFNPNMKIVLVVRDPIDRSLSQLRKEVCRHVGKSVSELESSFVRDFLCRPSCVLRSSYGVTVQNYLTYFPLNQIFVRSYCQAVSEPDTFLTELFEFLEVDSGYAKQIGGKSLRVNQATPDQADSISEDLRSELVAEYADQVGQLYELTGIYAPWMGKYIATPS